MGVERGAYSYFHRNVHDEGYSDFIRRPTDIDLGPTFNAMRAAQRKREWEQHKLVIMSANSTGVSRDFWVGWGPGR